MTMFESPARVRAWSAFTILALGLVACGGTDEKDCDDAGKSVACSAGTTSAGPVPPGEPFGGPYDIASSEKDSNKKAAAVKKKKEEFDRFNKKLWKASKVVPLSEDLLADSIEANSNSKVPDADRIQRYNYVVKDGSIWVAVWEDVSAGDVCKAGGSPPYPDMRIRKATMVNFQPEAHEDLPLAARVPNPACRSETVGVLDAHSKHFMLVQKEGTIADYDADNWPKATVDYAGELLVFLREDERCYIINPDSGTYQPRAGTPGKELEYLERVAKEFEQYVHGDPVAVWSKRAGRDTTDGVNRPKCWAPSTSGASP